MRRWLKIGAVLAVLALAAVMVGGAVTSAQEGDGPVGTFLARVAEKLGISEEQLKGAVQETQSEMIDEAVASGRLTEEQAARLKERATEGGFLFPPLVPGERLHMDGGRFVPEAAAQVLGITQDQLMEELRSDKTLAEVAEAQGMSVDEFAQALLPQVKAQLDSLVADGRLTQDQADEMFQRIQENIDSIVSSQGCLGGIRGRGPGPGGFGGPWFGAPSEEAPDSTPSAGPTVY